MPRDGKPSSNKGLFAIWAIILIITVIVAVMKGPQYYVGTFIMGAGAVVLITLIMKTSLIDRVVWTLNNAGI